MELACVGVIGTSFIVQTFIHATLQTASRLLFPKRKARDTKVGLHVAIPYGRKRNLAVKKLWRIRGRISYKNFAKDYSPILTIDLLFPHLLVW